MPVLWEHMVPGRRERGEMRKHSSDFKGSSGELPSDFELFQREFKKWQRRFGLTGYKVYFKHEQIADCFATLSINQSDMVVTATLNSKLPNKDKPFKHIVNTAKHEALHLLVGRLEQNGYYRHSSKAEIFEAVEELVVKLEDLIR